MNLTTQKTQHMRKFESVKEGDIVIFENYNMKDSGVVVKVTNNTFSVRNLSCWDNDGMKKFYETIYNFLKTGTKSHQNYTYGNAIEIQGSI